MKAPRENAERAARTPAAPAPRSPERRPARPRRSPLQRAAGNRVAGRMLARWMAHPDKEQKGVMVPDSVAGEYTHFNPPKNE